MEEKLIKLNLKFILFLRDEMKCLSELNKEQLHICQELSCEDDFDNDAELRYSHLLYLSEKLIRLKNFYDELYDLD